MKNGLIISVIMALLIVVFIFTFPTYEQARSPLRRVESRGMILPPPVTKILTLEFKSVVSDFLFVRASQYFGGKIAYRRQADSKDMLWLYRNLIVITDLDPYFEDPYYFGNALLTWDVGMYKEANSLLSKAVAARTWDWQFPFYLGFNQFYFLHEYGEAADSLLTAAKRPGAYNFLPTLAARLYSGEGRTQAAIVFLKSFIENERDAKIKKVYEVRLNALEKTLLLERAVSRYRNNFGRMPENLQKLVRSRIIAAIPDDPYGGEFFIDKDGGIQTTSNLAPIRRQKDQKEKSAQE